MSNNNLTLVLKLTADASGLVRGVAESSAAVDRFSNALNRQSATSAQASNTINQQTEQLRRGLVDSIAGADRFGTGINRNLGTAKSGFASVNEAISRTRTQLLALAGAASVVDMGRNVVSMADEYKNLEARLKLATKSQAEFNDLQGKLAAMADANRQSLSATIDLYSGIAPSLQRVRRSQEDILKAVDSVNKALVVGGATAQGSAASILQLTQALGSGVLRGDEFNSIMENGRGIALALADALHTDVGKLRSLAEQGKLSAQVVTQALIEQNDEIAKKYAQMPITVGQSIQVLKNNILKATGNVDAYTGASAALSSTLISLSKNLDKVALAGGVVAAIYGGKAITSLSAYIAAQYAAITADTARITSTRALQAAEAELAAARRALEAGYVSGNIAQVTTARTAEAVAVQNVATATRAVGAAAASSSVLVRGLSAALGLVGGPVGAFLLAVGGTGYWLKSIQTEQEKAKDAIKDANGEWVKNADILDKVKGLSAEYATATGSRKKKIEEETEALRANTKAEITNTEAKIAALETKLRSARDEFAKTPVVQSDVPGDYAIDQLEAEKAVLDAYVKDIENQKAKLSELRQTLTGVAEEQKHLGQATVETGVATGKTAKEMLDATNVDKKATESAKAHADTLKKVVEGLQQQRIALEHGKQAAQYYADRLDGLTDAEARAKAGAEGYNAFLEERQSLEREAVNIHGGLITAYKQKLDDAGINPNYNRQIDAIQSMADKAVERAKQYQAELKAVEDAAKNAGNAVGDMFAKGSSVSTSAPTASTQQPAKAASSNYDFSASVQRASSQYNVPEALIRAVIRQETGWLRNPDRQATITSPAGAVGVMQIMPSTGKGLGLSRDDLNDPAKNIDAGTKYLSQLMRQFSGDIAKVAAAYNAGPGAVQKYGGTPPYKETQDYVAKVTQYYKEYSNQVVAATNTATKAATAQATASAAVSATVSKSVNLLPKTAAIDPAKADKTILTGAPTTGTVTSAFGMRTHPISGQYKQHDGVDIAAPAGTDVLATGVGKVAFMGQMRGYGNVVVIQHDKGIQTLYGHMQDFESNLKVGQDVKQGTKLGGVGSTGDSAGNHLHYEVRQATAAAAEGAKAWQQTQAGIDAATGSTVKYRGEIDGARVTEEQRNQLVADYMRNQTAALVETAKDRTAEAVKTGTEYREQQLTLKEFNKDQQQTVIAAEQQANFAKESVTLARERLNVSNSQLDQYREQLKTQVLSEQQVNDLVEKRHSLESDKVLKTLKDEREVVLTSSNERLAYERELVKTFGDKDLQQVALFSEYKSRTEALKVKQSLTDERKTISANGNQRTLYEQGLGKSGWLDQAQIKAFSADRTRNEAEKLRLETEKNRQQALMTVDAYRKWTLENETGLTPSMARAQVALEKQAEAANGLKQVFTNALDAISNNLVETALKGKADWSGMIESIIAETMKLVVIKPFINDLSNALMGGDTGGGIMQSIGSMLGLKFANGGAFDDGVQAYANGGAFVSSKGLAQEIKTIQAYAAGDSFHNTVLSKPQLFKANGKLAVAGEAGPEAVMPLKNGMVQAITVGRGGRNVIDLPLTRINGRLGVTLPEDRLATMPSVRPFATGGAFGASESNTLTTSKPLNLRGTSGNTQISVQPQVNIQVINNAATTVSTTQERDKDGTLNVKVLINQLEANMTDRARRGEGLAKVFKRVD